MIIVHHDTQNGFVLPQKRWEAYVEGIVTQYLHGCSHIEITVGDDLPILLFQQFVKHGSISHKDIMLIDDDLCVGEVIPLDDEGDMLKHCTIGELRNQLLFARF